MTAIDVEMLCCGGNEETEERIERNGGRCSY